MAAETDRWRRCGLDDSGWQPARTVSDRQYRKLIDRPIPMLRFDRWKPTRVRCSGAVKPPRGVWGLALADTDIYLGPF